MSIKIVLPEGDGPKTVDGARVFTQDGHEIEGVLRVEMDMLPGCILSAKVTVLVSEIENLEGIEGIIIAHDPRKAIQ
ncbi:MAG TPA: hypothetical protein VIC08_11570 [Cellvibrionaceae bacterium]